MAKIWTSIDIPFHVPNIVLQKFMDELKMQEWHQVKLIDTGPSLLVVTVIATLIATILLITADEKLR